MDPKHHVEHHTPVLVGHEHQITILNCIFSLHGLVDILFFLNLEQGVLLIFQVLFLYFDLLLKVLYYSGDVLKLILVRLLLRTLSNLPVQVLKVDISYALVDVTLVL